jgi:hypothetical protein
MGWKGGKAKHCWVLIMVFFSFPQANFPAHDLNCLYASSKLSRPSFEVMGSNPCHPLKSSLTFIFHNVAFPSTVSTRAIITCSFYTFYPILGAFL